MVGVKVYGLEKLTSSLRSKLLEVSDKDKVLRTVATSMCFVVRERIHEKGLNAAGSQIGVYSSEYLKVRIKKGKTGSPKVILSFSRQMQNDFAIGEKNPIKAGNGWGLGFKNNFNSDKADWMEERYGSIYSLTDGEYKQAQDVANGETNKILKQ